MPDCYNRVVKQHPRAGPAHDGADAFTHHRVIAVDWAFAARMLCGAEAAMLQSFVGVG